MSIWDTSERNFERYSQDEFWSWAESLGRMLLHQYAAEVNGGVLLVELTSSTHTTQLPRFTTQP